MQTLSRREKERQARKEEIIGAAEKVFCQYGFATASMDEIAKAAQFTKRTVYQYFVNKEDLYCAVLLKERQQLFACLGNAIALEGTGFEKIQRGISAFHEFYKDFPNVLRLMNHADTDGVKAENSYHYQELIRLGPQIFKEFAKVIEVGKADGSIRADLDGKMAAPALGFILTGFFSMLAETGKPFTELLDLDQENFACFTLDLLCDALRLK